MASSPITSSHIDEGNVEIVADFIFLGLKITMDLDCSHKIKTHLLIGRKKGYEKPAKCQRLELLNCGAWEDSWESHIQQDQASYSERKSSSDPCCLSWGIYWGPPGGKNSTAKVPNHGSSKQFVAPPMEKLRKAEGFLYPMSLNTCIAFSPAAWRPRKGNSGPWRRWMAQGSTGTSTYQVGLERTEQAYVAESWWLGCGNKREPALHEVPHPKSPGGEAQW